MSQSPYQQPQNNQPPVVEGSPAPTPIGGKKPSEPWVGGPPPVWIWYRVYCSLMALLYLLCLLTGIFIVFNSTALAADSDATPAVMVIQGIVFAGIGLTLLILFSAALFVSPSKVAWFLGFATIGIGLTSICCMPASIPLLIFWLKDDTRRFLRAN